MPTVIHRSAALVLAALVLAACGGGAPASPEASEPPSTAPAASVSADPTEAASSEVPSEAASEAAEPSEGTGGSLAIPLESPCDAIRVTTVEELVGGAVEHAREWNPGDEVFGTPSSNYGCQYVALRPADGVPASEFGLILTGREVSDEQWASSTARYADCDESDAELGVGSLAFALCPGEPGYTNLSLYGLFGGVGFTCGVYRPDDAIDAALEAAVAAECGRILLELTGRDG